MKRFPARCDVAESSQCDFMSRSKYMLIVSPGLKTGELVIDEQFTLFESVQALEVIHVRCHELAMY